jgi:tight adherence protein C
MVNAAAKWPWIAGFLMLSAQLGPILMGLTCSLAPFLYVRAARRRRVDETEQDLPLFMDLFAALAEAGMGFDAALVRILESHPARRTLAKEFTQYRWELMAGMSRLQGLRNLSRRLNVLPLNLFVSAVIQAEQTGASIADTLRNQAIDGRERRKIRVLLHANTQPVRLSFPLIICFLPGLLVTTLGPALYHLLLIVNNMLGKIQ